MKHRANAPWALEGSYRALQKLSSQRGPAPRYVPPPPPPPKPKMEVEDIIEEVHHVVADTGRNVVCAMIHPEDYCDLLRGLHKKHYQMPTYLTPLTPAGPSSVYEEVIGVHAGVGQVEVRQDPHINKGSIVVVTK